MKSDTETLAEQGAAGWMLARAVLTAITQAQATGENLEEVLSIDACLRWCNDALDADTHQRCVALGGELADIRSKFRNGKE